MNKLSNVNPAIRAIKKTGGSSKLAFLIAVLALVICAAIAYFGFLAPAGLVDLQQQLNVQNQKITILQNVINKQMQQTQQLAQQQEVLAKQLQNITPNQANLVLLQLISVINAANQSILIYHDYKSALKNLSYAKSLLINSSDPRLLELKVNVIKDLDNVQAQNNLDNMIIAIKLDELESSVNQVAEAKSVAVSDAAVANPTRLWDKFVLNLKKIINISEINSDATLKPNITDLAQTKQQLLLNLLNARQALFLCNQSLWGLSLQNMRNLVSANANALIRQKQLLLLDQLQAVDFNQAANLDLTMAALAKLELP